MNYYTNANEIEGKIGKTLAKEGYVYTFHTRSYPITLIISRNQSPAAQMSFMETGDDGVSSNDASLCFIFELDGLKIVTRSRLVIPDDLMSKLKGLAKKLHAAYVHAYFADNVLDHGETTACNDADDPDAADDTETPEDDTPDAEDVPENEAPVTEDPTGDPFADFMNEPAAPECE